MASPANIASGTLMLRGPLLRAQAQTLCRRQGRALSSRLKFAKSKASGDQGGASGDQG